MAANADKKDALMSAVLYEQTLLDAPGVQSITRAGQHTAADGRLFFYVSVDDDAKGALVEAATDVGAAIAELPLLPKVDECLNCGNVADKPVAVCPNCNFREISPCPSCKTDVARQDYVDVPGDLFACPFCRAHVRLRYADPIWDKEGKYNEPVVIVKQEAG